MPVPLPHLVGRLTPPGLALVVVLALAGCQTGLPGASTDPQDGVTPNAVAGDVIEVTTLEDPALSLDGPVEPVVADPAISGLAEDATSDPATEGDTFPPVDPAAVDPAAVDAEPAPPPAPKSAEALACEKKGGSWASSGIGSLRTCVFQTRDSGKSCSRESDCEGLCLARSRTCAPVKPLLGCNDILQDNGVRATLCIE